MLKRKLINILLLSILGINIGKAQGISGKVFDKNHKPLSFVTISLHQIIDSSFVTGTVTNEAGMYRFEDLKKGEYYLMASLLSYTPYMSAHIDYSGANLEVDKIILEENANMLQEVVVTSKRPLIENTGKGIALNVANSIIADGSSLLDVISMSPGIYVDGDGNIYLRGNPQVRIFQDGRPIMLNGPSLNAYLRGLQTNAIDKIEIMTQPPAGYDAEGSAGVINIKTKKNETLGTNGSLNVQIGSGKFQKHGGGINLNHKTSVIQSWINYNFNYREDWILQELHRRLPTFTLNQDLPAWYPNFIHNLRSGMSYEVKKNHSIILNLSANAHTYKTEADNESVFINTFGERIATTSTKTDNKVNNNNYSLGANYKIALPASKSELLFDIEHAIYNFRDQQSYVSTFEQNNTITDDLLTGNIKGDIAITAIKSDYTKTLSNQSSIQLGYKFSKVHADNDMIFKNRDMLTDLGRTNHFDYSEKINSAYVSWNKSNNKSKLTLGLRGEHTLANGYEVSSDTSIHRSFFNLFPNISLQTNFAKKHTLTWSIARRIDRPNYQDLNPFLFFFDNYTFIMGNSLLKPQISLRSEVAYNIPGQWVVSSFFNDTKDASVRFIAQDNQTGVMSRSVTNIAHFYNYGLVIQKPLSFTKRWNSHTTLSIIRNDFDGNIGNLTLDNKSLAFNFNINHTFSLGKDWSSELTANYQDATAGGIFVFLPTGAVSFGIQKKYGSSIFRFNVRDIFFTNIRPLKTNFSDLNINITNYTDSRWASISYNYNFGNNKVKGINNRPSASEEERRRTGQ